MSNKADPRQNDGNPTAISVIKQYLDRGEKIPIRLKDELLFGALLSIYEVQACQSKDIDGIKPWVSLIKWCMSIIGAAVLLMLFAMLTHTFSWPF